MNNYQIYEEIGKGRFSTVYKGRRKKSIEYYAISSIDKSQRPRVLNSAHFLRTLSHKNILKFHNWYETNNHLWVITEYCTGGDLRTILQLDKKLPELSTRVLAGDLVEGLMYIHSRGIIYADVKPSNILMDSCAVLRFYDFGLSHAMDGPNSDLRVGTPSYMAPELFLEGGVHSTASDLWSLGCVLYEMAMGHPPFSDPQLKGLIQKITNEPFAKVEHYSTAFNELVEILLQKNPLRRASWKDVLSSEFWGMKFEVPEFPRHVAFEEFRRTQSEPRRLTQSREGQRKDESLLRASTNAERNLERELRSTGDYGVGAEENRVPVDREVDFRDPHRQAEDDETATPEEPLPQSIQLVSQTETSPADPLVFVPSDVMSGGRQQSPAATGVSSSTTSVDQFLDHSSDATVKPIVMNSRIERIGESKFDPAELGFLARTATQLKQLPTKEIESFLANIHRSLSGQSSLADKCNILSYLESLCVDTHIANLLINAPLFALCIKTLALKTIPPNLKALLCTILGMTFRHAAVISPEVQKTSVLTVLIQTFGTETNAKVRRRAVASLGELLFYIATQPSLSQSRWNVPDVESMLFAALSDEDEVTVHYVVKAIENILSVHDRAFACRFATKDFVASLLSVFSAPLTAVRSEHLRCSALCAALRMCLVDPLLIHAVTATLNPSLYGEIITSSPAKTLQAIISFVNMLLCKAVAVLLNTIEDPHHVVHHVSWSSDVSSGPFSVTSLSLPFVQGTVHEMMDGNSKFVSGIVAALEHSNPAIRGKACLCVLLLAVVEPISLHRFCQHKLFTCLHKLLRDTDAYVTQCSRLLVSVLQIFVNSVIGKLAHSAAVDANSIEIVLSAFTSQPMRETFFNDELLVFLAQCVAKPSRTDDVFVSRSLWPILEAIANDPHLVTTSHLSICGLLLTPLVSNVETTTGDTRFMSLKAVYDLLSIMMSDGNVYSSTVTNASTAPINEALRRLIALVDSMLEDAEPMPLFCLKLLSLCCDRGAAVLTAEISRPQLIDKLLMFLDITNSKCSVCVANVLLRCLQCGGEPITVHAIRLGLVGKLAALMHHADECEMGLLLDRCLEIVFCTLCIAAKSPTVQAECVSWSSDVTNFIRFALAGQSYAECAASCVHLLSQLYVDAQQRLLSNDGLALVREGLAEKENFVVHVGISLLRALHVSLQQCGPSALRETQTNEMLLLQLQGMACDKTDNSSVSKELSELAGSCLSVLFERSQQLRQ